MNINPTTLLAVYVLSNQTRRSAPQVRSMNVPDFYLDTFKLEVLIDRLTSVMNTVNKLNSLNKMAGALEAPTKVNEVLPAFSDKTEHLNSEGYNKEPQNDMAAPTESKSSADMESLMKTVGPMLNLLASNNK